MIQLIPNLPGNTVGVTASGQVDAGDYETVLIPAIEAALKEHEKVRFLYFLSGDFTGFTLGAMWDDMKVGFGHLSAWEKIAVVTDVNWVANATRMFGFIMPCPVKVFAIKDRGAAEAWIAA
ncbi:MAG TPA: STAS/SEC14 domain-containing protein [Tepidisphaeraceae bacterium]|jgi:hypothetical protein|nr:STAS/SEC14 domain-containing protein [Tepidisphaeraceae bacterium]